MSRFVRYSFFFFFNDTATTEIYTLSLHDALPIFDVLGRVRGHPVHGVPRGRRIRRPTIPSGIHRGHRVRLSPAGGWPSDPTGPEPPGHAPQEVDTRVHRPHRYCPAGLALVAPNS